MKYCQLPIILFYTNYKHSFIRLLIASYLLYIEIRVHRVFNVYRVYPSCIAAVPAYQIEAQLSQRYVIYTYNIKLYYNLIQYLLIGTIDNTSFTALVQHFVVIQLLYPISIVFFNCLQLHLSDTKNVLIFNIIN